MSLLIHFLLQTTVHRTTNYFVWFSPEFCNVKIFTGLLLSKASSDASRFVTRIDPTLFYQIGENLHIFVKKWKGSDILLVKADNNIVSEIFNNDFGF